MKRPAIGVLLAATWCPAQPPPASWALSPDAIEAGYTLEMRRDGNTPCAVIVPPRNPRAGEAGGHFTQTLGAAPYRGKTVRLSAWIRVESQTASARLWMRAHRAKQASGLFDDIGDQPVKSADWTRSEITLAISPDADTVGLGILAKGGGPVWVKDLSLLIISGMEEVFLPADPLNLGFAEGTSAGIPSNWKMLAEGAEAAGYRAETRRRGCHAGPPCAVLAAATKTAAGSYGALLQTFGAANYRGKTIRLRALLRLQAAGKDDQARLFLRTGRPGETVNAASFSDHLDYREVRTPEWTPVEVTRKIDEDVQDLSIGALLAGRGRVWIDEVSFSVVPDSEASIPAPVPKPMSPAEPLPDAPLLPLTTSETGRLSETLPASDWPSLPRPGYDEQKRAINAASLRAASYIHDLPNFLCTLSIHRAENLNSSGWKGRDVLHVQLGFVDGRERYKLLTVNDRATSRPYRSVGGAISEGDFGSALAEIFRPHSARFYWDHWANLRHRVVHVYRYEITQAKSAYELQFGGAKGRTVTTVTAHHGYVYIDRDSSLILRIEQVADPPAGFPLRTANTVIDYEWNDVGGHRYLLPLRAEISMGVSALRSLNVVEYRDYKKFGSETQVRFDEP
ncbi:MAG: hypothetical protein ABUS51_07900 [Acidobacteriota bacterium]